LLVIQLLGFARIASAHQLYLLCGL